MMKFMNYESILEKVKNGETVIQAKFVAFEESFGSKPPKTRKEKAVATKAAKSALAKKNGLALDRQTSQGGKKEKAPSEAKAYGTHSGGTHVHECSEEVLKAGYNLEDLNKAFTAFERAAAEIDAAVDSNIDVDARKRAVEAADMQLEQAYRKRYGLRLNEAQSTQLRADKSNNAIHYWGHQLKLFVYSDTELRAGLSRQNSDGVWITIFCSKTIWRDERLPLEWVTKHITPVVDATSNVIRRITVRDSAMVTYLDASGKVYFLNERQYVRKVKAGLSLSQQKA